MKCKEYCLEYSEIKHAWCIFAVFPNSIFIFFKEYIVHLLELTRVVETRFFRPTTI